MGMDDILLSCEDWAYKPVKGHVPDAGVDLRTPIDVTIPAGGSAVIDTGVHADIPYGWFGKLESKSGLDIKHCVACLGGVIDTGFTGTIKTRLYNFGDEDYEFKAGDKCVQIVFTPCEIFVSGCEIQNGDKRGDNG